LLHLPCFPNPFNPHTTISLQHEEAADIRLAIYDLAGRRIRVLHDGRLESGRCDFTWKGLDESGRDAPSGVYLVLLEGAKGPISRKITMLR
ncbi:T9SS type A sorting domain-containing protein, partial [bacterium]|nr:T9SS type A sorting domain-containing protein [bacterium]